MESRLKLAVFIIIFTACVVLSFYIDDYISRILNVEEWWGAIPVFAPIVVFLVVFGSVAKNIKRLAVYSFFAGMVLTIFFYAQDFFSTSETDRDLIRANDSRISIFLLFCLFTVVISFGIACVSSLGMLLSYACKLIFNSKKVGETELQ